MFFRFSFISAALLSTSFLFSLTTDPDKEQRFMRRIQAHLMLKDGAFACEEAQQALNLYPDSVILNEWAIRAFAQIGAERAMLQAWDTYIRRFPNQDLNRELIEQMAWGVLNKASNSSSLIMREMALLAAYFSHEGKGVNILYQGMHDPNYAVRTMAVKLAGHFRDTKLIEEMKRLLKSETVWPVRKQVLESIGKMKIVDLKGDLEAIIASDESLAEEKALAIASLLHLFDQINRPEVERLASSNRAGLRQLACQAIAYFSSLRDLDQLLQLAKDPKADVRAAALQAIGQLRPSEKTFDVLAVAREGTQDSNPAVALSAAWLLTLYVPEEGQLCFLRHLRDERRQVQLLASAALGATGSYGIPLIYRQFQTHPDLYVRLNLGLALIGQRYATREASSYLSWMLMREKDKWYEHEIGLFTVIVNKPVSKGEDLDATPELDNQLVRLELLNLLAILKEPNAQRAIRDYLMERSWGVSATAAALLLTEGDETAVVLVQQLLEDPQPRIRLQAALVLSIWSREENPIQVLEEAYSKSEHETKSRILESLGRIGSMRSVPFLIECLKEPSQTLRLIAAMALIQCLNH